VEVAAMGHIVISYDREDIFCAEAVVEKLKARGFEPWFDVSNIRGGDEWAASIDDAILQSDALIAIMTERGAVSSYVTYEWSYALGAGVYVIPIMFRKTELPAKLQQINSHDFTAGGRWDAVLKELDACRGLGSQAIMKVLKFRRKLSRRKDLIRKVGIATFNGYVDNIESTASGFGLQDRRWALSCNEMFWSNLTERPDTAGLTVFVTHSASVEIWLGEEATSSLVRQKEFISNKGARIVRVFIGKEPAIPDAYKRAMSRMMESKVDTYYVSRSRPDTQDYTWIPALGILMTWTTPYVLGDQINAVTIAEVEKDSPRGQEMAQLWRGLTDSAISITGETLRTRADLTL
jgi:hypothetical protein